MPAFAVLHHRCDDIYVLDGFGLSVSKFSFCLLLDFVFLPPPEQHVSLRELLETVSVEGDISDLLRDTLSLIKISRTTSGQKNCFYGFGIELDRY